MFFFKKLFQLHRSKIFEREGKLENSKEKSFSLLTNFLKLFPIESRESTAPLGVKTFSSTLETTASKNQKRPKNSFPPSEGNLDQKRPFSASYTIKATTTNHNNMSENYRQQKKMEKTRPASPYETRNAKKAKNTTVEATLAAEIATVTQSRNDNNNNKKPDASFSNTNNNNSNTNNCNTNNNNSNTNNNNSNTNNGNTGNGNGDTNNQATHMEVETTTPNDTNNKTKTLNPNAQSDNTEHNEEWSQVSFKRRYTLYVDAADCSGKTQAEKRQHLEDEIDKIATLIGISTKKIEEAQIIKIDLASEADKTTVGKLLASFKINHRTSAKGKDIPSPEAPNRLAELVVRDIL